MADLPPPPRESVAAAGAAAATERDDEASGLGVVRIKPLGSGGGGVERGAERGSALSWSDGAVRAGSTEFTFPTFVAPPEISQAELFDAVMPDRIEAFFAGYDVNVLAFGQTGTGKTHTMFGPPGTMARAAGGEYGCEVFEGYGLFPRGLLAVCARLRESRAGGARVVLTCAAVELGMVGNEDMFDKDVGARGADKSWSMAGIAGGVALDKATTPPSLYGQREWVIETERDVLRAFGALATRNTAGTGMNDSSSRSHCFAWLTLHSYDADTDAVRASRFQFVDLAGSERMRDAHGTDNYQEAGMAGLEGVMTNYSLGMLSQCLRHVLAFHRRGQLSKVSFKAYTTDLVSLLASSLNGAALTAVFVCLSQTRANLSQSKNALGFGRDFARLSVVKRRRRAVPVRTLRRELRQRMAHNAAQIARARDGPTHKYTAMREAQQRRDRQLVAVLEALAPSPPSASSE